MHSVTVIKWGDGWKAFLTDDPLVWEFAFDMLEAVKKLGVTIGLYIDIFTVRLSDWER